MKKINSILLAISCMLFSACGLDYSENTFYSKEEMFRMRTEGVDRMVWGIYAQMRPDNGSIWSDGAMLSSACDESVSPWANSTIQDFNNGVWSSMHPVWNGWEYWYSAIRQANLFLNEASGLTFDEYKYNKDYNDYMKKYSRYKYEVRLLRAYFYFNLVRAYGDVPLVTEVLDEVQAASQVRVPAAAIFDFICHECDDVAPFLPVDYAQETFQETGRVTRSFALALKARAALYAASPLFNVMEDPQLWAAAAEANLAVIDDAESRGIVLGNYEELWGSENFNTPEVFYAIRETESNQFERYNFPIGMEGAHAANCPTQNLVDAYELKSSGKVWNEPGSGYDPADPYQDLDPRFSMTVARNGDKWPEYNVTGLQLWKGGLNASPAAGASPTGYYLKKYCDASADFRPDSHKAKRHSFIVFRLGEFYLNYAEAVYHVFGNAEISSGRYPMSANDAVNKVRSRPGVEMPLFSGNADFLTRYRRERMVELSFEGHRFWDVRRWKLGQELFTEIKIMKIHNLAGEISYERDSFARKWEEKMNLFPIPSTELEINHHLMQNKGW